MAEILQLAQLVEHHRVTDVNVGRRGIKAELAAQLAAFGLGARELLLKFAFNEKRVHAAANGVHRLDDIRRDFVFLFLLFDRCFRHRCVRPKKFFFQSKTKRREGSLRAERVL